MLNRDISRQTQRGNRSQQVNSRKDTKINKQINSENQKLKNKKSSKTTVLRGKKNQKLAIIYNLKIPTF